LIIDYILLERIWSRSRCAIYVSFIWHY